MRIVEPKSLLIYVHIYIYLMTKILKDIGGVGVSPVPGRDAAPGDGKALLLPKNLLFPPPAWPGKEFSDLLCCKLNRPNAGEKNHLLFVLVNWF